MAYQKVFKRYEIKYMITQEQKELILSAMEPYMRPDRYGLSTIRNLYYDTEDHILARRSIAKPDFKEKLRIRSYSRAERETEVFVELKRKCEKLVYKRRIGLPERDAMAWTCARADVGHREELNEQMISEIDYFLDCYQGLKPVMFISYRREAYRMKEESIGLQTGGDDFRVTFDDEIIARDTDLSLRSDIYGTELLPHGMVLMEIKCSGGIPLWMIEILSEEHIYKTSFSKYGKAYTLMAIPDHVPVTVTEASRHKADERKWVGRKAVRPETGPRFGILRHASS